MARKSCRPAATAEKVLQPIRRCCPVCGQHMQIHYHNVRSITTLKHVVRLILKIRRCVNVGCSVFHRPYRPEGEGALALPEHEFGLDVIALVGLLRYQGRMSVPEIHTELLRRKVPICERSVTNLLERYDELAALHLQQDDRLQHLLADQGQVIVAIDGIQPDKGHEVLWVVRDVLSGEVLLARSLLSACEGDLAPLLKEVQQALPVPVVGVISDGQTSLRKAVASALPGIPHQICQFHYLREAARPIFEADRHAKKELKKRVRGIRAIEREIEDQTHPEADVVRGYCSAVRSAITDDGYPPLSAPGLKLHERLRGVAESLDRLHQKGALPNNSAA